MNFWKLLIVLVQEKLRRQSQPRIPEPESLMTAEDQVRAFDSMGATGDLIAVYHFNLLLLSPLLSYGAKVLDLGCGTGRFMAYLARFRPDLQLVGIDLSEEMIRQGQAHIKKEGLDSRVRFVHGDMLKFRELVSGKFDFVLSLFSLHHLPTEEHLSNLLAQLAIAHKEKDIGYWIFDFNRPRWKRTPDLFIEAVTPNVELVFKTDSINSLKAAFTAKEISQRGMLQGLDSMKSYTGILPLYQIHLALPKNRKETPAVQIQGTLDKSLKIKVNTLLGMFPDLRNQI